MSATRGFVYQFSLTIPFLVPDSIQIDSTPWDSPTPGGPNGSLCRLLCRFDGLPCQQYPPARLPRTTDHRSLPRPRSRSCAIFSGSRAVCQVTIPSAGCSAAPLIAPAGNRRCTWSAPGAASNAWCSGKSPPTQSPTRLVPAKAGITAVPKLPEMLSFFDVRIP